MNPLATAFTTLLNIQYPIVSGGMGPPSSSPELVAAVCNAGGFGVLGCSGLSREQIQEQAARVIAQDASWTAHIVLQLIPAGVPPYLLQSATSGAPEISPFASLRPLILRI